MYDLFYRSYERPMQIRTTYLPAGRLADGKETKVLVGIVRAALADVGTIAVDAPEEHEVTLRPTRRGPIIDQQINETVPEVLSAGGLSQELTIKSLYEGAPVVLGDL